MNWLLFLTFVFVFSNVHGDVCCPYPLKVAPMNQVNVTMWQYQCAEPIELTCQSSGRDILGVGIAGKKFGSEEFEIITENKYTLVKDLICGSPSSQDWHLEGSTEEYEKFSCALKSHDGHWVYA